jgi:hypothetical protein
VPATLFVAAGLARGETRRAVFEGGGTESTRQINLRTAVETPPE